MQLSVVIPVLDAGRQLAEQLDALVRQRYDQPWEVVLADNGSTDPTTLELMQAYARVHSRIVLVDASTVAGKPAAVNAGVRAARGELILLCDADDVVGDGWVDTMARALGEHDFVCGPLEYERLNPAWAITARGGGPDQVTGPLHLTGGPPWPFALGANLGIRRSAHELVSGYDEGLLYGGEDCDYAWRLAEQGIELHWEPAAVVHYRNRLGLRSIYRQAAAYGASHARLQARWGHVWPVAPGVPDRRARVRSALRTAHRARSRAGLGLWFWNLGWEAGAQQGATAVPLPPLPVQAYGRSGHLREPAGPAA